MRRNSADATGGWGLAAIITAHTKVDHSSTYVAECQNFTVRVTLHGSPLLAAYLVAGDIGVSDHHLEVQDKGGGEKHQGAQSGCLEARSETHCEQDHPGISEYSSDSSPR